eukprot:Colp12_sorted_trinity150504_noHs@8715
MNKFAAVLACLMVASVAIEAKTAQEWAGRSIYQILTDRFARTDLSGNACTDLSDYCGGTFKGIERSLDYIQGMGFDAIWISPVVANTEKGYHGYWAQDLYRINERFGTPQDLKDLVAACHARDIWVVVDVVANHMGNQKGNVNDFSMFQPFNSSDHYHNYCIINNWNNQNEVENCRLAGLPDLKQENSYVRSELNNWIRYLVQTYDFDAIRIDTIVEVPKDFWSGFVKSAGVYAFGEAFNGNPDYVFPYIPAVGAVLNYPMYYTLRDVFQQKAPMTNIKNKLAELSKYGYDLSQQPVFINNHDNQRWLHTSADYTTLKNALAYVLLGKHVPIVYYGSEQAFSGGDDPQNREALFGKMDTTALFYKFISEVNQAKKAVGAGFGNSAYVERYVDNEFFCFSRDQIMACLSNVGSGRDLGTRSVTYHPYADGTVLYDIHLDRQVTVTNNKIDVTITNGQPQIYIPLKLWQVRV